MVAIVAGNGLGLLNTSLNTVGPAGVLGESVLGQGSSRAIVNAVNGNVVLQTQDAQLAGGGTDLFALRTYNSLDAPSDGNEDGWRWGYEQTVRFDGPGAPMQPGPGATVVRTDGDGHETTYAWDTARAAYVGTEGSGAHDELRYDGAAAEWVWTDGSTRVRERYSDSTASGMTGRLVRRTDTSNNSIALTYDDGRLTLIRDAASQQELRLTYGLFNGLTRPHHLEARWLIDDANGRATATLGDPLRMVEYDYDSQGRLTTVTRHLTPAEGGAPAGPGFITSFSYADSSARIASVTQSDGTSVSFTYDAVGRVSAVTDHSGTPGAQFALAYGPQPNSTAITDGDGRVWTYRHDGTGQLIEVLSPPVGGTAPSTTFLYDAGGKLAGIADPNGNAVTYGYDNDGNRALERDAIGNTTTRTFSPLLQVLTETRYRIADPDGPGPQAPGDPATTRYVYDANARLRFVLSAEGRVTENCYGGPNAGHGLLTQTLLYVGQLYDVTALGPTQQLTETDLNDWVAGLPDKTQVQLTEYSYDLRGNMSQQTSYATVSAGGAGVLDGQASVAEYVYDPYSQLRQRIAVRGSARDRRAVVSSFAYDGVTRVLESAGADGRQTTVYDDANGRVSVTTASGLSETREYDGRGRLASVSQTGDGTTRQTRYVYDNADRLRMLEDAQGGRRYRFYDAAGRLEHKVDATGAVTRFEHSAAGQLVRQTQYLNRVDTGSWYDSATHTVTKPGLTAGGAGSDVVVDAAHDRVTTFDYDAAGRLTASTDAVGTVTTVSYDGLSRVIMTQTGDRVTRYLYDKDNRRVGIVDALAYFTEYKYDAGGRLMETVRYSQRSPAALPAESHHASAWRPADDTALHSYLYYDGRGRVVGAVDEQQFLTETVYDDALNTQQTLRYLAPVSVASDDDLASLKSRAGASRQISLVHYDDFGRVHEVRTLDGSTVTRNEFDEAGRVTRVVSAASTSEERVRCTFYNAFGEVAATVSGEGGAWLGANPTPQRIDQAIRDYGIRHEYDALGRPARSVDGNGNRTLFYRDRESRLTHTVHVIGHSADNSLAGEVSETTYNSFGQAESVRRYAARITNADMDQLLADGGGGFADQSLLGKLAVLADASLDQVSFYEYDRRGHLVKQLDGEGGFTEMNYDVHGQLATQVRSTRDGQTTTQQFDYDSRGRVVSQTDDVGGINANTRTDYDAFGRVIRTVDAAGRATTTAYEDSGRSIAVTDPLQRMARTEYDALGRVSRMTNALGQQSDYAYDETARSVTATTSEGRQVTTLQTRHGETLSVMDTRGNVTRYGFNRDGQPTTVTDALGRVIARTNYDKSGRTFEVTDARATATRFGYDQRNRVVERRVDPTGLNLTTRFEFDALGQQTRVTEAAGTQAARVTTFSYDRKGRTKTIVLAATAGGLDLCTTYAYDGLDNAVTVARGTVSTPNQHVMLYEFDNVGRRAQEIAAPASVFGAGAPGTRDIMTQYRYDACGRVTRRIAANGQSTWYVYDAAGQLTHTISPLGEVSESRYDAAGRLIYSHRYLDRLTAGTVAGFGDAVVGLVAPTATPNDRRSHIVYDADGQTRFSCHATGVAGWVTSENRHDADGNVIEVRAYDRFLPDARVAAIDSAGSPGITVSEIQQELRTTLGYEDDDPATLVGVQRTFFVHDANDRVRFTVDSSGSVSESV